MSFGAAFLSSGALREGRPWRSGLRRWERRTRRQRCRANTDCTEIAYWRSVRRQRQRWKGSRRRRRVEAHVWRALLVRQESRGTGPVRLFVRFAGSRSLGAQLPAGARNRSKSGTRGRQSQLFRVRMLGGQHGLYAGQQPSEAAHAPAILSAAAALRVLITGSLVDWPVPDPRARHDDLQVAEAQREPLVLFEHIRSTARLACRQLVLVRVRIHWRSVD